MAGIVNDAFFGGGASSDLFGQGNSLTGQLSDQEEERRKRERGIQPSGGMQWSDMMGAASRDLFGARGGGVMGKGFSL